MIEFDKTTYKGEISQWEELIFYAGYININWVLYYNELIKVYKEGL